MERGLHGVVFIKHSGFGIAIRRFSYIVCVTPYNVTSTVWYIFDNFFSGLNSHSFTSVAGGTTSSFFWQAVASNAAATTVNANGITFMTFWFFIYYTCHYANNPSLL